MAAEAPSTPFEDLSDWARVDAMRDEDIVFDEDSPRTYPGDWDGATIKRGGVVIGTTPRRRGPGKKPSKIGVLLRLDPDTLAAWKATGRGWQTRMASLLAQATVPQGDGGV